MQGKSKRPPPINARGETLLERPMFKGAAKSGRCLIPADGFYEWRRDPEGKQPIWFSRSDEPGGELFAFAGIWARLERKGEAPLVSCALITCPPNDLMRPVHDRMPVVLPPDAESTWIDPDAEEGELLELLRPAPEDALRMREVGDDVNDVRKDGPALLEPPMKLF